MTIFNTMYFGLTRGIQSSIRNLSGVDSVMSKIELFVVGLKNNPVIMENQNLSSDHYKVDFFHDPERLLIHFMKNFRKFASQKCAVINQKLISMSGVEVHECLRRLDKNVASIMISESPTPHSVLEAWRAGVDEFLFAPFSENEFMSALKGSIAKRQNMSSTVERFNPDVAKEYKSLTNRERQVMSLIVDGKMSGRIAQELGISLATTKMHRANLMRKLGVHNAAQLSALYFSSIKPDFAIN